MKIHSSLMLAALVAAACPSTADERAVIRFAETFKEHLIQRATDKMQRYVQCNGNNQACEIQLNESLAVYCSDDRDFVKNNGSVCELFRKKSLKIDAHIINMNQSTAPTYWVTFFDSDLIPDLTKASATALIDGKKGWKGYCELLVFTDINGALKIKSSLFESASMWTDD